MASSILTVVSTPFFRETPAPMEPTSNGFFGLSNAWKKPVMWHGENALGHSHFGRLEMKDEESHVNKNSLWII